MPNTRKTSFIPVFLAFGFAIAIQIQLTIFQNENYSGLRVNLADFILPFAGISILVSLLQKKSRWPHWIKPTGYWIPVLLISIMSMGLIQGYWIQGEISQWSLFNKYIGWFVIMAYFLVGSWMGTNINSQKITRSFFFSFLIFSILTLLVFSTLFYFGHFPVIKAYVFQQHQYLQGLMGNRNSYGFLILSVICFVFIFTSHPKTLNIPKIFPALFWALMPLFFVFNSSRILFIGGALILIILIVLNWQFLFKKIAPFIAIGLILLTIFYNFTPSTNYFNVTYRSTKSLIEYVQNPENDETARLATKYGNDERVIILKDAWELIKQYPVQGAGLGSTIYFQKQEHGQRINIIDSSPIWILTEMGMIGILGFGLAYIAIAVSLRRKIKNAEDNSERSIAQSAALMLLCFSIFCLFHEILYTRFFWFILGLAIVHPLKKHHRKSMASSAPDPILEDPVQNPDLNPGKTPPLA